MRARILAVALGFGGMGLMASCDLGNTLNETLNVFSVRFSSADPAYSEPTIGGPSLVQVGLDMLGGKTKEQVLGEFTMNLTFNVLADNSQNSRKAAFGSDAVRPQLNFRLGDRSAKPIVTPIAPFSVEAGKKTNYPFTVKIPLTSISDRAVLKNVLSGASIPYFLSGSLDFKLMDELKVSGTGISDVELSTGAIPTRGTGGLDLGKLAASLL